MVSTKIDLNGSESIYHVLNELHVTKRCCQHDNILDCNSTVQNQKISVSFESGKSLNWFSLFQKGYKEEHVSYIIRGTLEALECIHVRGNRVHGNANLNTVFFDKDCRVKLEFPTRITNPDLENNAKKDLITKIDIWMVGELACSLFHGKSLKKEQEQFAGFLNTLPPLLHDFVKFCLYSSRTPTISTLKDHILFKELAEFDKYQEELKKLLE